MRTRLYLIQRLGLCLLLTLLTGCSFAVGTPTHSQIPSANKNQVAVLAISTATIDTVAEQVLQNMHLHSWNPDARTRNTITGGLFINWKMDNPKVTNAVRPGADGNPQHNHDPQVDLLYLISLAEYQQLHPNDHTYDTDMSHTTLLVLTDFRDYNLPKVKWTHVSRH